VSRRSVLLIVALGGLIFLLASFLLARVISAANDERAVAVELVKDQARGDAGAMVATIDGCDESPACRAHVADLVRRLSGRGRVEVLNVKAPGFSLGGHTATTRVAWRTGTHDPFVQCVRARRTGDPLAGYTVRVLALSDPIGDESSCPE
jgi:hypothetical protein